MPCNTRMPSSIGRVVDMPQRSEKTPKSTTEIQNSLTAPNRPDSHPVKGTVMASAVVAGEIQTRTLKTGESWTPGEGDPHPAPPALLDEYAQLIDQMILIINQQGPGPVNIPIRPVFPTGNPPGGGASSPDGTVVIPQSSGGNGGDE